MVSMGQYSCDASPASVLNLAAFIENITTLNSVSYKQSLIDKIRLKLTGQQTETNSSEVKMRLKIKNSQETIEPCQQTEAEAKWSRVTTQF